MAKEPWTPTAAAARLEETAKTPRIAALVRTEAHHVCREIQAFTAAEIGHLIEALWTTVLEARRAFPCAMLSHIRSPRPMPRRAMKLRWKTGGGAFLAGFRRHPAHHDLGREKWTMTTDILSEPNHDVSAERALNPPARKASLDNRDDDGVGRDTRRVSRGSIVDVAGYAALLTEVTTCTK